MTILDNFTTLHRPIQTISQPFHGNSTTISNHFSEISDHSPSISQPFPDHFTTTSLPFKITSREFPSNIIDVSWTFLGPILAGDTKIATTILQPNDKKQHVGAHPRPHTSSSTKKATTEGNPTHTHTTQGRYTKGPPQGHNTKTTPTHTTPNSQDKQNKSSTTPTQDSSPTSPPSHIIPASF